MPHERHARDHRAADRLEPADRGGTIMLGMLARPRDAFDVVIYFPLVTAAETASG
jgi:hypothetical protein